MFEHPIVMIIGALLGVAIGLDLCAAMLLPRKRGPQLRCADEIATARRRAEERRRDWERRDAARLADARALRR